MPFYVRGLVLPPPEDVGRFRGTRLNKEEITRTLDRFVGRPVCYNHDKRRVIGSIKGFEHQPNRDIHVDLYIDDSTADGKLAANEIRQGIKKGLSVQLDSMSTADHFRFDDVTPIEISVVDEGGVDRSRILAFGNSARDIKISQSGFHEVFGETSQTMETAPQPPTAIPASAEDAKEHNEFVRAFEERGITKHNYQQFLEQVERVKKMDAEQISEKLDGPNGVVQYATDYLSKEEFEAYSKSVADDAMTKDGMRRFSLTASAISNFRDADRKNKEMTLKYEALLAEKKAAEPTPMKPEDRRTVSNSQLDPISKNRELIMNAFKRTRVIETETGKKSELSDQEFLTLKASANTQKPKNMPE